MKRLVSLQAIKLNRRIRIGYQRFGGEAYEKTVEPYTLKLFRQRWYILVFTGHHIATYALDRMLSLEMTEETFEMPADFSPQGYFAEYFGVLTDETPMEAYRSTLWQHTRTPQVSRALPPERKMTSGTTCKAAS